MWLTIAPLLGVLITASAYYAADELPSCGGHKLSADEPLWMKKVEDEAHFLCSPGFLLDGHKILSCSGGNWNHRMPKCKPTNEQIRVKFPYNVSDWSTDNLNAMSKWLKEKGDTIEMLKFPEGASTKESRFEVAEMLARFRDPFYQFYSLLSDDDRLDYSELEVFEAFRVSPQYKVIEEHHGDDDGSNIMSEEQLTKSNKAGDPQVAAFISTNQDTFKSFYGNHWLAMMRDFIRPYVDGKMDVSGKRKRQAFPEWRGDDTSIAQSRGSDYFGRPVQVLSGTKAEQQDRMLQEQYAEALRQLEEHAHKFGIPRSQWPDWSRYPHGGITQSPNTNQIRCPIPRQPRDGRAVVSDDRVIVYCNEGFMLRGPSQRTCRDGQWYPNEEQMCVSANCYSPSAPENGVVQQFQPNIARYGCLGDHNMIGNDYNFCEAGRWTMGTPLCRRGVPSQTNYSVEMPATSSLCMEVNVIAGLRWYFDRGSKARIMCLPGYRLNGPDEIFCRANVWTPEAPTCINDLEIRTPRCPVRGRPENGGIRSDSQEEQEFFCNTGYQMVGRDRSRCLGGYWDSQVPRCIISGTKCRTENPIARGAMIFLYDQGNVRYYECQTILGGKRQYCMTNGEWSQQPICASTSTSHDADIRREAIECPDPPTPSAHGITHYRGRKILYRCEPGYDREGAESNECSGNRWLNPPPICRYRTQYPTARPPGPPPPPPYPCPSPSRITGGNAYVYRHAIFYMCSRGFKLRNSGKDLMTCDHRGNWSNYPPTCEPDSPGSTYGYGDGQEFTGGSRCTMPIRTPGIVIHDITREGAVVHFRCTNGVLEGSSTITCHSNGEWSAAAPNCHNRGWTPPPPAVCEPTRMHNGRHYIYSNGSVFQCNKGFTSNQLTTFSRCETHTGRWRPEPQICVATAGTDERPSDVIEETSLDYTSSGTDGQQCPLPSIQRELLTFIFDNGRVFGFKCRSGYQLIGAITISCGSDGWTEAPPTCEWKGNPRITTCDPVQNIHHGDVYLFNHSSGGSTAVYQCHKGYRLSGLTERVCTGRRNYEGVQPSCDLDPTMSVRESRSSEIYIAAQMCQPAPSLSQAVVEYSNEGTTGRYVCEKDYHFEGRTTEVTCSKEDGQFSWTNMEGSCILNECSRANIEAPQDGSYFIYGNGLTVVFQCNKGFKLQGKAVFDCQKGIEPSPRCEKDDNELRIVPRYDYVRTHDDGVMCETPSVMDTNRENTKFYISSGGAKVTYVCTSGSSGVTESECVNGEWSKEPPLCPDFIRDNGGECESVLDPENGSHFRYEGGGAVYFQCNKGFTLRGSRVIRCQEKQWQPSAAVMCERTDHTTHPPEPTRTSWPELNCPLPSNIPNAKIRIQNNGEIVRVTCHPGYVQRGDEYMRCRETFWTARPSCEYRSRGDGEQFPPVDPFGRPVTQMLTGEKAQVTQEAMRRQYEDYVRRMNNAKREYNAAVIAKARERGEMDPPLWNPRIAPASFEYEPRRQEHWGALIDQTSRDYGSLSRQRRKNHPLEPELEILPDLSHLEKELREANMTSEDLAVLIKLTEPMRMKFIEEKIKSRRKQKDDPVKSRQFLDKIRANKKPLAANQVVGEIAAKRNSSEMPAAVNTSSEVTTSSEAPSTTTISNEVVDSPKKIDLEKKAKQGYDTSCAKPIVEAPMIENGFVYMYHVTGDGKNKMIRARYRCNPDYKFQFNNTDYVYCRHRKWVGELPSCVPA